MSATFVESEVDLGLSGGTDQATPVNQVDTSANQAAVNGGVAAGQDGRPDGEQQAATATQEGQQEGVTQQPTEDKTDWATAPEHFRNSYQKAKALREQA